MPQSTAIAAPVVLVPARRHGFRVPDLLPTGIALVAGALDGQVIRIDEKRETSSQPTKRTFRTLYRLLLAAGGFAVEYANGDPRISATLLTCSTAGLGTELVDWTFKGAY